MLMHYFCFTNATTPVSGPWPQQSSCYKTAEHRVTRPPYSIGILTLENW